MIRTRLRGRHAERHRVNRVGWLRAAVLGANDGLLSTASLIVGVAAAAVAADQVLVTGVAGLVAGAMSMAAGEYVSVSSQADSEAAERSLEIAEIAADPAAEHRELAKIYEDRGLEPALAAEVATQLMAKDAIGSHLRDELGLSDEMAARPVQAALASAASFAIGAALPLLCVVLAPVRLLSEIVFAVSLLGLAALGAAGASLGGAPLLRPTLRVLFWGALAMAVTIGIGRLFGATV